MGAVRFLKPWSLYNSGETAGFDDDTAAMLISSGVAVDAAEAERDPEPVDPVEPDPVEPAPVEPVEPDPVEPDPVDPVEPDPVEPDPVEPDPVQPEVTASAKPEPKAKKA